MPDLTHTLESGLNTTIHTKLSCPVDHAPGLERVLELLLMPLIAVGYYAVITVLKVIHSPDK